MFGEALQFPVSGDSALKNHLIGGVLAIFGFLLFPIFFVQGYLVRVVRVAVEGGDEPPTFDDWGDLFVDGLKLFVVTLGYVIVPTILLFVSLFAVVGIASVSTGGQPSPGAIAGASIVGLLVISISVLLFIVAAYLIPAAVANFARHDDVGKAFEFGTVLDAALTADYFVALLFALLLGLIIGAVTFVLSVIVVGLILVPFVSFYSQVATYYLFGRGYAKGLGIDGSAGPSASGTTPTYE